jgi:hypothetical protein
MDARVKPEHDAECVEREVIHFLPNNLSISPSFNST